MKKRILFLAASVGLLVGCPDDETTTPQSKTFEITVTNLTVAQPLSPIAILSHSADYHLFKVGEAASLAIEKVAESGDNSDLLAEKDNNEQVKASYSGSGVILPGEQDTLTVSISDDDYALLSVASMLVNTNDAFIGETQLDASQIEVGASYSMNMPVWDAGTEANSETAATIPGPAGGGEGFNAARDDNDKVTFHAGVVTSDDGLATSALTATHRFLNPAARVTITRTE